MEEERKKSLGFGIEDFDHVKLDPNWTRMDCLVAVAERALYIYNRREIAKGKRIKEEEEDDDHSEKPIKTRFSDRERSKRIRKKKIVAIMTEDIKNRRETRKRGRGRVCRASAAAAAAAADDDDDDQERQEKSVEEEEGNRNKRQKKKNTARASPSSSVPTQLPQEYRRVLERFAAGKSIQELNFILRKDIYKTDISPTHCRLSLPRNKQQHSYLTEEEENYLKLSDLNENGKRVSNSMEVQVIEPSLQICKLELKNWAISKGMYVLTKDWNKVVERNNIKNNETIQVWTVRVNQQLCFILVRVPIPEDAAEQD